MTIATQTTMNRHTLQFGRRVQGWIRRVMAIVKVLGPYAAIELVLPGGSVIAVLLWLYRRSKLIERNTSGQPGSALA